MNVPNLGETPKADAQRDAVHFAVAPAIAGDDLYPGMHVGPTDTGHFSSDAPKLIGIVDPFMVRDYTNRIKRGDSFWLMLYPNTITSLRHEWTHPAMLETPPSMTESEVWLRDFANASQLSYEDLLAGAEGWLDNGEGIHLGVDTPDYNTFDFWKHFNAVTGIPVSEPQREEAIFSCAC